jgi:hypothetical protein
LQEKQKAINRLVGWLILNFNRYKIKTAPGGSRNAELSANIESLLNSISNSEETVSICLPILLKTILQTDFKLRELLLKSKD